MQLPETWLGVLALVVLVCAVLGGALTAFVRLADKNTPVDTGLLHGRAGAIGILLLLLLEFFGNETHLSLKPALTALVLTVVLGTVLYYIIRRKGILPKTVILVHAAFAVTGLALLLSGFTL